MERQYRKFLDIAELIDYLKRNERIRYHAPMDVAPHFVMVRRYTIDNEIPSRSSACLWTRDLAFTVKLTEHFDRFRLEVPKL